MTEPLPLTDPQQAIVGLAAQQPRLELSTLDICFLVFLDLRGREAGLTAFDETRLTDAFEQVCNTVEPNTENITARANHSIRRLREQRLLARVDGAGVVRSGEFALSRLGVAVVAFYLEQEVLTPQSLSLLTRTLLAQLAEILAGAQNAKDATAWQQSVTAPLEVTVKELIQGIERRQRGLDTRQQDFQKQISQLLLADWFGAIDQCQDLLDTTASTLRELSEMLLREVQPLHALLQELLELADAAHAEAAFNTAQQVIDQIDRMSTWGSSRQAAWSEYYDYVHRYLRDVVRLDPSRALSQRLRAQLTSDDPAGDGLIVAHAAPFQLLREVAAVEAGPPVRRPRAERAPRLEQETTGPSAIELLRDRVLERLAAGTTDLFTLTAELTEDAPDTEHFVMAGRIAQIFAELRRSLGVEERDWIALGPKLALEQRNLPKARPHHD